MAFTSILLNHFRVIRIFKIFHSISRFRTVLNTLSNILPSLSTYGGIFFILYYFFAVLGMELFQGKVLDNPGQEWEYCGNSALRGSEFARSGYCPNNFNDVASSFVVLFTLMVVNQWHIITDVTARSCVSNLHLFTLLSRVMSA